MRKALIALALAMVPQAVAIPVLAADEARPPQGERRAQPTAEEKAKHEARRKEMREKREANMSPEQKARHEARRKEWASMTPEQREAKKKEMREKQGDRPQRPRQRKPQK